jgi:hypothetical protein
MYMDDEIITLLVPDWVYALLVASILTTLGIASYIYTGSVITAIFMVAGWLALIAWFGSTYRTPTSRTVLPTYILAVVVNLFLVLESYYFGYADSLKSLFPSAFANPLVFNETIYISIAMVGVTLYLLGGFGVFLHHPLGNYMAWFLFSISVVDGLAHYVLPLLSSRGFQYVPGMVMSVFAIIIGLYGGYRLLNAKGISLGGVA